MANHQVFAFALAISAKNRWAHEKYAGSWRGTYSCGGVGGEATGPRGPFSIPVSAEIDDGLKIKLERTTAAGGFESLSGSVIPETGVARLDGIGENSPDDKWQANYQGKVTGNTLQASGGITPTGSQVLLRGCTINLQRGSVAAATAAAAVVQAAASASSPSAQNSTDIVGTWKGELLGEGKMEIRATQSGFDADLAVTGSGGCGGEFKGSGSLSNQTLSLKSKADDQACTISVKFASGMAKVDETDCSYFHGAACGFDGTLTKVK